MHLKKRLAIIPDSETLEKMEALADLAHIHATIGELEDAPKSFDRIIGFGFTD